MPLMALLALPAAGKNKKKKKNKGKAVAAAPAPKTDSAASKKGPKPFAKVITDKAVSKAGLFKVYKVEDKWYFELPDSLLNREIMVTTRFSKIAGGGGTYAGEMEGRRTVMFERGPNNDVFMRVIANISVADSSTEIFKAVANSNLNPIAWTFEIKALSKDSAGVVIDVTDFFKGDNQPVSLSPMSKKRYNLANQVSDRSYISSINTYPINTEVKVVRTFSSTPPSGPTPNVPGQMPSVTLPAAYAAGAVTVEMNNSFILLPKVPMAKRLFDPRVGYFADAYQKFDDDQQKVDEEVFAVRWRLEPKPEDVEKYKRGELVEPQKPIIYYIDPATPKKWRKYLIQGINDWQVAFERAGFKNAIWGREFDTSDATMNLEDARFSVVRYLPSDIPNAYGPNVHDPRTGEILESHIGWYHNVMKLVHDWYFVQAAAVDERARKMEFDDELMGQLIRFVSSHEVGHTLGLRHNMGSSSLTPVEKLRDKAWVEANGHTASIMDYARFNYVAQPGDAISDAGMFPRIGDYDKWAIEWGYKLTYAADHKADQKVVNKWIIDSLKANPRLWFGTETNPFDPRSQTEDLGDNSMVASTYGIANLKRVVPKLVEWTYEEADKYDNLETMYNAVVSQWNRYMGHVVKNIGGVYETPRSVEETGKDVYEPAPVSKQKEAVEFLNKQLFTTPEWLLNKDVLNKINNPVAVDAVTNVQVNVLNSLFSVARLNRMAITAQRYGADKTYAIVDMMTTVRDAVWLELKSGKAIDGYRRSLQKAYVEALIKNIKPMEGNVNQAVVNNSWNTDAVSISRGHLKELKQLVDAAAGRTGDKVSKYHLQDVSARIEQALNPKN